jgi:hypothetical protein
MTLECGRSVDEPHERVPESRKLVDKSLAWGPFARVQ